MTSRTKEQVEALLCSRQAVCPAPMLPNPSGCPRVPSEAGQEYCLLPSVIYSGGLPPKVMRTGMDESCSFPELHPLPQVELIV